MEFIERLPLLKLQYLKSLSFKQYKSFASKSATNDEDRKIQFDILKKFCDNAIKANGEIKRLYKFTGNNTWGTNGEGCGRLFSAGLGIQGMPKAIRGFLLDGITSDIDMANAHPVILRYLCRKHDIAHDKLDLYITNRDEILSQFPDRDQGKTLFLKATNHDKLNKKEKNPIFREYDKQMKDIQNILTKLTCYKEIVKDVPETRLYNWNGSAINRIMCFFENKILQVIMEKLNEKGIEICAPMFDGCMPYGIFDETILPELEYTINVAFPGLDMKLTLKADGTSERVSLEFQHIKSIDKLLQFYSELIKQETVNYEKCFVDKLNGCIRALSHFGIWQRLVWTSETRQNPILLNLEIQRVRNTIPELLKLRIRPTICTFSGSSLDLLSLSESNFDPIFHSLEKLEIDSLLRSLRYIESTVDSDLSDSLHTILETVYGSSSLDLPKIFGISDSNQLAFLSSLQYKEVSNLIKYLESLVKSEKFQFSSKPLELKNSWPASIDKRLNELRIRRTDIEFCEEAHRLEALLIEHEVVLLSNFISLLASVLERFFKSEDDLLKQYPLLREILAEFSSENSCRLVCGHYVFLRLKLRSWTNSFKEAAPGKTWDWSITLDKDFEPGDPTIDSPPAVPNNLSNPGLTTGTRRRRIPQPNLPSAGRNGHQNLLDRLSLELKSSKLKLSSINVLKSILADNLFLAPDLQRHVYYCKAVEHIELYEAKVDEYSTTLAALLTVKPFNKVEVQAFRDKLTELEKTDDPHYKSACDYLDRFESLLSQQRDILHWKTSSLSFIGKLEEEAAVFGVVLDPDLLQLKIVLEEDIQILEHGLTAWALDTKVIKTLMRACEHFPNRSDPFLLESTTINEQRAQISNNGYIDKIKTSDDDGTLTELFEKLRKDVQNNPLYSWVHSKALVAVVAVMPSQFGEHRYKLWEYLLDYLGSVNRQSKREVANIIMLVLARIDPKCDPRFRKACLRKLYSAKTAVWMTEDEIACLQSPFYVTPTGPGELKTPAVNSPSILKLMDLVGLDHVKKQIEELHKSVFEEKRLNPEFSVIQSHHFILMGNPGTGKTTVAKIIHELLTEAGIRSSSPFIELSGDAILQMGFDQFSAEIVKAENGVVFIDDAHALSSTSTPDGPAIIELILDFAESHRHNTIIILAGNKDGIEDNLLNFHSGFASRFPHIFTFDDYTDEELGSIFRHMCRKRQWSCFNDDVVRAAVRRISRHRGRKAFCNARSVRDFLETTYRSTICTRRNHPQTFILADVLGPNPDPKSNFGLKTALDELNKMVGLKAVKEEIRHLIDLVTANYYDHLLRGEISLPTFRLNRVFLGSPGTGKTTVAKLYGRVLKDLGILSDGGVEIQHSKDLIGASDGESHKKITALLERCAGKVLIIDEAVDLFESPYGSEAVNSMVGMLHNYLVDDIANVLIGYDMKICEKLRAMSESLTWRFWLDRPFAFEDYTDDELGHIATDFAARKNLSIKLSAQEALIRSVSSQRCLPQFESAGTIIDLMNKAIASLTERDPSSKVLTLEDFGLPSSSSISSILGKAIRRVYKGGV